jgi:cytochrome c peroxidase
MILQDLSRRWLPCLSLCVSVFLPVGCASEQGENPDASTDDFDSANQDPVYVASQANKYFKPLPSVMQSSKHPVTDAKVTLGRQLFFEKRLSKNQDLACNSCHDLTAYGIDVRAGSGKTSLGHRGQVGTRNAPTVYNAALQIAQFWDGRAADVEAQAQGPILNPIEMALPTAAAVATMIKSIPGYMPMFTQAFPGVADPITLDNVAIAIGAFERKLVTKDRFDRYLIGDATALTDAEKHGLATFMDSGCPSCHTGADIGGAAYKELGVLKKYPTTDVGRYAVTKRDVDKFVFKVPSLRNIEKTAPYFHDGSQPTLEAAVKTMAEYQTVAGMLSADDLSAIITFLKSLTGELPASYIVAPPPLAAGPSTPAPDPS